MSPETVAYVIAAMCAAAWIIESVFDRKTRALLVESQKARVSIAKTVESLTAEANGYVRELAKVRAERDAALRDKAAQFEEAQRQIAALRKDVDTARESYSLAARRATELRDKLDAALARAERAEKVAAAAAKLFNGKSDDGEFRELKDAVREWQEGGAA